MPPTAQFRVYTEVDPQRQHVRPVGDLDVSTVAQLLDSVGILRYAETLVMDLSGVTFLGAAGLGAIITIRNELTARSGTLIIEGVPPRHARLFMICGLASLI